MVQGLNSIGVSAERSGLTGLEPGSEAEIPQVAWGCLLAFPTDAACRDCDSLTCRS
jgi:hypothetical protein